MYLRYIITGMGYSITPQAKTEAFWEYVDKRDDCWIWSGPLDCYGYGVFSYSENHQSAHRASWAIAFGPIPAELQVHHVCGEPTCVRPEHLALCTKYAHTMIHGQTNRSRDAELQVANTALLTLQSLLASSAAAETESLPEVQKSILGSPEETRLTAAAAVALGRKGGLANKGIAKPKSAANLPKGRPKGAKNKPKLAKALPKEPKALTELKPCIHGILYHPGCNT